MAPKQFNVNAYGNPRAKFRRQNNPTASESNKLPTVPPTSGSPVPGNFTQEAASTVKSNTQHSPSDIKPTQVQLFQTTHQQSDQSDLNSIKLSNEIPPGANPTDTPANKDTVSEDKRHQSVRDSPKNAARHSPLASPTTHENKTAFNKLDSEPENGVNGGVALTMTESCSKVPRTSHVKSRLDSDAQLKQLQDLTLKKIHRQGKNRRISDEKHNTTSLRDLDLARTPVNPNKPSVSGRPWAQGSPVIDGKEGEEYTGHKDTQQSLSRIPEIASSRLVADTEMSEKPASVVMADSKLQHGDPDSASKERESPRKRPKWASKESMQGEREDTNSNAWGSAAPSDATRGTNPSDNRYGRLLNKTTAAPEEDNLGDWDGKLLPAPADWYDRPRFNNNSATFKNHFDQWLPHCVEVGGKHLRFNNGIEYIIISRDELKDSNNHADGISMVPRGATINTQNAARYGYPVEPDNATKYSKPVEEHDFENWGKLDPADPDNQKHGRERSQELIDNWLKHLSNSRAKTARLGGKSQNPPFTGKEVDETHDDSQDKTHAHPNLNIYLRPATKADLPEMTRIYNWYIANTTRPVETQAISESDMRVRMEMAASGKLPFLVAGKKSQRGAQVIDFDDGEAELYRQAGLPFAHRRSRGITRIERLAGFCCLQEFTAADFVEHITGEMEIYVDPQYVRMGVGRCLMDKMLEICDRSHIRRTLCDFHCEQSIRHNYGPGGARDLHKFYIILRKWHTPKAAKISVEDGQRVRNNAYTKTQTHETEYELWQKAWFERFGFEEEATLKKAGAKHGRYLDLIYLARETSWCPSEGQIPEPFPGYLGNNGVEDDDDDGMNY